MAAIFAVILLPVIAALGFMTLSNLGGSGGAPLATRAFAALARRWENEGDV